MDHLLVESAFLTMCGFLVGIIGTIVGAGGGFLLLPILLTVMQYPIAEAAGTSQVYVLVNAASGAIPYCRHGRVRVRAGLIFAAASTPGTIIGATLSGVIPTHLAERLFAVMLIAIVARMVFAQRKSAGQSRPDPSPHDAATASGAPSARAASRFHPVVAAATAFTIGIIAGLFGIGGGPLQVPALISLFAMPIHVATATSVFILAITGLFAAGSHLAYGHVLIVPAIATAIGGIAGAQVGVRLSGKIRPRPLMIAFSTVVLLTAGRMLVAA